MHEIGIGSILSSGAAVNFSPSKRQLFLAVVGQPHIILNNTPKVNRITAKANQNKVIFQNET